MRTLAFASLLIISTQVVINGQNIYLQLEQCHGISSFLPSHSYKVKFAYQYGVSTGIDISKHLDASIGIGYQNAGVAEKIWEIYSEVGTEPTVRQILNANFFKIPIDINFKFGKRSTYSIGLGAYYNFNLNASFGTDSPNGTIASSISLEELSQNDYGIRFKPNVLIPLNEKFLVQLGILQQFGLKTIWYDVVHSSTSAFAALRYTF